MPTIRHIGVLTSGGDCPGLNSVIRAVTLAALKRGWRVSGILGGTAGLLQRPVAAIDLTAERADPLMARLGGTVLGATNRPDVMLVDAGAGKKRDRSHEAIDGLRLMGIDVLIAIGGDGTLAFLNQLCRTGQIPLIGIPKTIDNDVYGTDLAIGHDSAVSVAVASLDQLQPTAASHQRIAVLEVMGRDSGHIALATGVAGGADVILIPEIPADLQRVADQLQGVWRSGRHYSLVVIAEGVPGAQGKRLYMTHPDGTKTLGGIGHDVANRLATLTGLEARATVLGHVQRGAAPSARDRLLAGLMGAAAVTLAAEGQFGQMVTWHEGRIGHLDLAMVAQQGSRRVDVSGSLIQAARDMGICLGDD